MNQVLTGIAIGGTLFVGANSLADDSGQSQITRQQMAVQILDCVKKRVATRTVSYHEAIKACKEQVRDPGATPPPERLLASGAPDKP
jgi:hypothetical protein